MKKIFLYIRLSDADDDLSKKTESDSIGNQRALLRQYINTHEELKLYEVQEFVDDGFSGTNDQRPSFERMIAALKNGESQIVICKDFSRFFRDYVEIGDYLERIFPFLGVRFISVNDGYDSDDYKGTTAGMDVVMRYIVYSYYSRDLSQKIRTVMQSRIKHGEFIASYAPYGYLKDPNDKHKLVPDPVAAPIVKKIFSLSDQGTSLGGIAKILNQEHVETPAQHFSRIYPESRKFSHTSPKASWEYYTVQAILKRLQYTGANVSYKKNYKTLYNPVCTQRDQKDWLIIPDQNPALVSKEVFDRIQEKMVKKPAGNRQKQDYPLRTLVHCGECGRAMQRNSRVKRYYWQCTHSYYAEETSCPVGEKFYEDEIEKAVINSLRQMLLLLVDHEAQMKEALQKTKGTEANLKQSVLRLEQQMKALQKKKLSAYEAYSDGRTSREEYLAIHQDQEEKARQMREQLTEYQKDLKVLEENADPEMERYASAAHEFLNAGTVTNRMLLYFISNVDVYTGMRIEIHYRFSDELISELTDNSPDAIIKPR